MCDSRAFPHHYVYKYISNDTGDVIFIGKTNASLKARIKAHAKEPRFFSYLDTVTIFYTEFSTLTETDSVELFLINELKPILNSPCADGNNLYHLSDKEIDWQPYSDYLLTFKFSKQKEASLKKEAFINEAFLNAAIEAYQNQKKSFQTPFLHPTGIIPNLNGNVRITKPSVKEINGFYEQDLYDGTSLDTWEWRARYSIWLPVAQVHEFSEEEEHSFDVISRLFDFTDRLLRFHNAEFVDNTHKKYQMVIGKGAELIISVWKDLFSEIEWITNGECLVTIDPSKYEKIPLILESIAKDAMNFFKETGVLNNK